MRTREDARPPHLKSHSPMLSVHVIELLLNMLLKRIPAGHCTITVPSLHHHPSNHHTTVVLHHSAP